MIRAMDEITRCENCGKLLKRVRVFNGLTRPPNVDWDHEPFMDFESPDGKKFPTTRCNDGQRARPIIEGLFTQQDRVWLKRLGISAAEHEGIGMANINTPFAGRCDEPSYTTPRGFPICGQCRKSTRNKNNLVCAPCRSRTRLVLSAADRKWLRKMGIAR